MANKYRNDQSPEDDSTSGVGSLDGNFEETLPMPIEAEADGGGDHAVLQESYDDREFWRKGVSKLTLKGINSDEVTVSENKFQASSSAPAKRTWPLYSDGQDVPRERVEHMRNSGEGKSNAQQIYSRLADQLQGFEGGDDCYLLPIENGILFSKKKIATSIDNEPDSVCVEQEPRRGKFFLNEVRLAATVSQDSCITYRPAQGEDGGNFRTIEEKGIGSEGTVYKAEDVLTVHQLAVKKMQISREMLRGNDPFAAFVKLAGCEQTCRAYGVILDEDNNCVYFLMELLEGKTLADLLGDENVSIAIPSAVDYTIDILEGLQYIHSKGMIHEDILGVNIMILEIERAIIIDTTGARKAGSPKSQGYLWDVANAIRLLNKMLSNSTIFSPKPWKASDEDRRKFNKKTLQKLENLLHEYLHVKSKSPTMDIIETLLQDLGEISEELKDSDGPDSPEDEAYQSSKDTNQTMEAQLEAYKAEIERERELRKKAEQDKMKAEQDKMKAEQDKMKVEQENKELNNRIKRMNALMAQFKEMEPKETADKKEDP